MRTESISPIYVGTLKLVDLDDVRDPMRRVYLANPLSNVPKARARLSSRAKDVIKDVFVNSRNAHFNIYDPADYTRPGSAHSPDEVYETDILEVARSDLLVLCHTSPADGTGIEFKTAIDCKIPTIVVQPQQQSISRLLLARPTVNMKAITFATLRDLKVQLTSRMPEIARITVEQHVRRRHLQAGGWQESFRRFVVQQRILRGLSRNDVARTCAFSNGWMRLIEEQDEIVALLPGLDRQSILLALDSRAAERPGIGFAIPQSNDALPPEGVHPELRNAWRDSLENLTDFVMSDNPSNDRRVREIWSSYNELMTEAVAGRDSFGDAVTIEMWRTRYNADNVRRLW